MRFAYYDRLSPARQKTYRASDGIVALGLPRGQEHGPAMLRIEAGLRADERAAVHRECQVLVDALTAGYHVPSVRVSVHARRPTDSYGELHGLYEPEEGRVPARISIWMRTAHRQQVVAFKTFLRTLIHELCHHLDYELFALEETFHTEGFYKRESSLVSALLAQREAALAPPPP